MTQPNHLQGELSPYLQQHVTNPVDWYPWGEEAFRTAKALDKPIFLSIGYATCHWCHVMEKESFKNNQIAEVLNDTFINIKVDREELPQVDSLYMEFAQAMLGGGGGWPLNLVLTPDLKPIFAATYMPPEGRGGQIGLKQLARRVQELWGGQERELVLEQAEQITHAVREAITHTPLSQLPEEPLLEMVLELQYKLADPVCGGLQGAPKFPMGFQSLFLLRHAFLHDESRALFLIQTTLEMMHRGGIYDHLGGGFSRYAVDASWIIPHFEKMTYDNAILAIMYTEAYRMTGSARDRTVAEDTLRYLLRDMRDPNGGFYSAEDADSEGQEGRFYTWTIEEIHQVLGPDEGRLFCFAYGVTPHGNFDGRNVLYLPHRLEELAAEHGIDPTALEGQLRRSCHLLWERREQRIHPDKDDKIVTAWNGLMIRTLSDAAATFLRPDYLDTAIKVCEFCHDKLWTGHHLLRRWRAGQAGAAACVEDYAYFISGLLSLHSTGGDSRWLAWAIELTNVLTESFRSEEGGLYRTDGEDPNLIMRQVEYYDGAEPSGNAVHAENLLRLYQITGANRYRLEAEGILTASRAFLEQHPLGGAYHCMALQRYLDDRAPTLVIALNEHRDLAKPICEVLASRYAPHAEVIWRRIEDPTLFTLVPSVKSQHPIDGNTTLYLCRSGVCEAPENDPSKILETLSQL